MTARAARKRRTTTTMPPVEPTPQKPAVNEGAPPAGHPAADASVPDGWLVPNQAKLDALAAEYTPEGLLAGMVADGAAADGPGDSAPYQLPDGSWEVLTLNDAGAVTGRRAVEGPTR